MRNIKIKYDELYRKRLEHHINFSKNFDQIRGAFPNYQLGCPRFVKKFIGVFEINEAPNEEMNALTYKENRLNSLKSVDIG